MQRLTGIGVSPGVVYGRAVTVTGAGTFGAYPAAARRTSTPRRSETKVTRSS